MSTFSKTKKHTYFPRYLVYEDGLTRRSPKRSQAAQPPLERRGALWDPPKAFLVGLVCDFAREMKTQIDTGVVRVESPSSPRGPRRKHFRWGESRGVFSKFCSPLDYVSARTKLCFKRTKSQSRMIGGLSSVPSGGGKPEWGSPQNMHFVGSPVGGGLIFPARRTVG